jgi:alcohol dehydrogenase (cytochrome c)
MVNGNYESHRYSSLDEITRDNVGGLRLAFAVPIDTIGRGQGSAQGYPVINEGSIYVADQFGTIFKLDGKDGSILWACDTGINTEPGGIVTTGNKGVALWGDMAQVALPDGRVVACDSGSGELVWEAQIMDTALGEASEGVQLAMDDKLIVGQTRGDWTTRGYLVALDPNTGDELWRWYSVPEPGQPGSETWKCDLTGNPDCWKYGGGAFWTPGSYDAAQDLIVWGTGNPGPMMDPEYRPGDNLYTMSTVALSQDTGELAWYFQYIPGDMTDYDPINTHMLIDTSIGGTERNILALFNRNGFFYRLDRNDGTFIDSHQYITELNWTAGIDPKTGHPVEYDPGVDLQVYAFGPQRRGGPDVTPCPHQHGGVNFQGTAYNPETGITYAMSMDFGCYSQNAGVGFELADAVIGQGFMVAEGGHMRQEGDAPTAALIGIDIRTGETVARWDYDQAAGNGGTALSPGLVWSALNDGTVLAFNDETLEPLWSTNTGIGHRAGPSIYAVDGKQYVTILAQPASAHGWSEISAKPPGLILFTFTL